MHRLCEFFRWIHRHPEHIVWVPVSASVWLEIAHNVTDPDPDSCAYEEIILK